MIGGLSSDAQGARKRPLGLLLICLGVAGFKLWLVAGDGGMARTGPLDPIRDLETARELARGHSLGEFGHLPLVREFGFPAWAALVDRLGVPLRIANEWLLLGVSGLFCAALAAAGVGSAAVAAVYALLVLEPSSLVVHRETLPVGFYFPVLLGGLAALVQSASSRGLRGLTGWAAAAGVAFGILGTTRIEKPLLMVPVGVWAVFDLLAGRRLGEAWRPALRRSAALLCLPVAIGSAVVGAVAFANFRHDDVFATSDVSAVSGRGSPRARDSARDSPLDPAAVDGRLDDGANRRSDRASNGSRRIRDRGVAETDPSREDSRRRMVRRALWRAHPVVHALLGLVGLLAALALAPPRRRDRCCEPAIGVVALLLAWVLARFALLGLVDASSFSVRSVLTVYPAVSLYGCAMVLLAEQGLRNLRATPSRGASDAPRLIAREPTASRPLDGGSARPRSG